MVMMLTGAWTLIMIAWGLFACTAGTDGIDIEYENSVLALNIFALILYTSTFYLLGAYFGV